MWRTLAEALPTLTCWLVLLAFSDVIYPRHNLLVTQKLAQCLCRERSQQCDHWACDRSNNESLEANPEQVWNSLSSHFFTHDKLVLLLLILQAKKSFICSREKTKRKNQTFEAQYYHLIDAVLILGQVQRAQLEDTLKPPIPKRLPHITHCNHQKGKVKLAALTFSTSFRTSFLLSVQPH